MQPRLRLIPVEYDQMLAAQALGQRRAVRQGVPAEPARCAWRQPLLLYHQCILFQAGPGDAVAACQTCQAFIQYAAEVHLFAVGLQAVAQFQQERLQGLVLGALANVAEGADRPCSSPSRKIGATRYSTGRLLPSTRKNSSCSTCRG